MLWASLVAQLVKNPPAMWETWVQTLDWEDPLEKGKVTHSSILAWKIPWAVWSVGSQRVTFTLFTSLCFIDSFLNTHPTELHSKESEDGCQKSIEK